MVFGVRSIAPPSGDETGEIPSLSALPLKPGVYLFRDQAGELLYVGKAKRLRPRVRSYFRPRISLPRKTSILVTRVHGIEALVVQTEEKALLLEAALIRRHRPRFNRRLKEGRGYPFLRISLGGPVPRIELTSTVREDDAAYFGPFPAAGRIRVMLDVVRRLSTTRSAAFERGGRDGELGAMVQEVLDLVEGNGSVLLDRLEQAFRAAVASLAFERAASLHAALRTCQEVKGARRLRAGRPTYRPPQVLQRIAISLPRRCETGLT